MYIFLFVLLLGFTSAGQGVVPDHALYRQVGGARYALGVRSPYETEGSRLAPTQSRLRKTVARADPERSGFGVYSVGDPDKSRQFNTWTRVASYHLQIFYGERMGGILDQNLYPQVLSVSPVSFTSDNTSSMHFCLLVQLAATPADLSEPPLTMVYQPDLQAWLRNLHTKQPPARGGQSLVSSPDRVIGLMFGGLNLTAPSGSCNSFNDTWVYDAKSSLWINLKVTSTEELTPVYWHSAAVIANGSSVISYSMWVFGGARTNRCTVSDELWELRFPEGRWTRHEVVGGPARRYKHQAIVTKDNTMIVFGGVSINKDSGDPVLYTDMWEYFPESNSWTQLKSLVDKRLPTNSTTAQCIQELPIAYLSSEDVVLVFATMNSCNVQDNERMVWLYKRSTDTWHPGPLSPATPSSDSLQGHYWFAVAAGLDSTVYHFAHSLRTGLDVIWAFRYSEISSPEGVWFRNDNTEAAAYQRFGHSSTYSPSQNLIYVLGGKATLLKDYFDNDFSSMDLLMFETKKRMWTRCRAAHTPASGRLGHTAVLIKSTIYVYGGHVSAVRLPALECLDTKQLAWLPTSTEIPLDEYEYSNRSLHTAVNWQDKMIVIGGQINERSVSSTWMFTPQPSEECRGQWTPLYCTGDIPVNGVLGHTAVVNGNDIYLFGGGYVNTSGDIYAYVLYNPAPLWRVSLADNSSGIHCHWTQIIRQDKVGKIWPVEPRYFHSATLMGDKMVIAGGCSYDHKCRHVFGNVFSGLRRCCIESVDPTQRLLPIDVLPVFDTSSSESGGEWFMLSMQEMFTDVGVAAHTAVALDSALLIQGGQHSVFDRAMLLPKLAANIREDYMANISCPAGTYSEGFIVDSCHPCPVAEFSPAPASNSCRACPPGTQTYGEGSMSVDTCQKCIPGTCHWGTCLVDKRTLTVSCECRFGYLEVDKCKFPFIYLALFACVILLVIGIACGVYKYRSVAKKTALYERRLRTSRKEIAKLTNVWEIDFKELHMHGGRLDKKDPGAFGEVRLATYRDMDVAVKLLREVHMNSSDSNVFRREVEVMRTIRHPNIVLFLGAGFHKERPFLVMEYMQRGTLNTVLHNPREHIDKAQQLRFALDIAKGMRYLHSQNHVHRDLKPANLLVSDRWVVKVADFGTARLLNTARGESLEMSSRVENDDDDTETRPLLPNQRGLTQRPGTILWMAPEVGQRHIYGPASDIYR